jgi:FKBP-type peptidyl-prolyl cis-trans isomerase FkpA
MRQRLFFFLLVPIVFAACGKSSSSSSCSNIALTTVATPSEVVDLQTYLTINSINATKDSSGIFYEIITPGTGTVQPAYCSKVTVTYVGTILNRSDPPFDQNTTGIAFDLRNLIQGWQRGIPLIRKGGTIRLYIPPSLAYGSAGSGGVPANAYLRFDIGLLDVVN